MRLCDGASLSQERSFKKHGDAQSTKIPLPLTERGLILTFTFRKRQGKILLNFTFHLIGFGSRNIFFLLLGCSRNVCSVVLWIARIVFLNSFWLLDFGLWDVLLMFSECSPNVSPYIGTFREPLEKVPVWLYFRSPNIKLKKTFSRATEEAEANVS